MSTEGHQFIVTASERDRDTKQTASCCCPHPNQLALFWSLPWVPLQLSKSLFIPSVTGGVSKGQGSIVTIVVVPMVHYWRDT